MGAASNSLFMFLDKALAEFMPKGKPLTIISANPSCFSSYISHLPPPHQPHLIIPKLLTTYDIMVSLLDNILSLECSSLLEPVNCYSFFGSLYHFLTPIPAE